MSRLRFLALAGLLSLASAAMAQKLVISGTVTGLPDGSMIYLGLDPSLDSAVVKEGKFKLSTRLDEKVGQVVIRTAKLTDYVFLWAENGPATIHLVKGAFKESMLVGQPIAAEQAALMKTTRPVRKSIDSLQLVLQNNKEPGKFQALINELNSLRAGEKAVYLAYVKNHPDSWLAASILAVYASTWGKELSAPLYAALTPELKTSSFGKSVHNYLVYNKSPKKGDRFEDFEQLNPAGKKVKLSDIKGKYVLLEFWASWCGPCRDDNPGLVATYNKFKGKGFEILGVSLDNNRKNWVKAIADDKLPWENISDLNGDGNVAALIYGIHAVPANYLIDAKGIIIATDVRGKSLEAKLSELLP